MTGPDFKDSDSPQEQALRVMRRRHPGVDDERLLKLAATQWLTFNFACADLGHAIRDILPRPIRKLLGG